MDELPSFSFSKKPIAPNGKRESVISATLPDTSSDSNSRNSSLTHQIHRNGRTFSTSDNLIEELPTDNPLLDYDEQIRAPKFVSQKSVDQIEIGHLQEAFAQSQEEPLTEEPSASPLDVSVPEPSKSTYQPAEVALSCTAYGVSPVPSSSQPANYTLSHYISSANVISNLETSPLSSKKTSEDSIVMLSSKKAPRFPLAPVKPISDPKTPNYLPCVLRPLDQPVPSLLDELSIDTSSTEVSREHWKPNSSTAECADCHRAFSLMNRRHHCRKCGEIFCAQCLLSKARLGFDCAFDVNGTMCKVCFQCGKQWGTYLVDSFKVDMMPDFKGTHKLQEQAPTDDKGRQRELSNVPADWSWSSF